MKLALIVRRLSVHGGTERFVHGLARWLVDAGHSVDAWCAAVDVPVAGVGVRPLAAGGRGVAWKARSLDRAARQVPRGDYDLVLRFVRSPGPDLYRAGGGCHAEWVARNGRTLGDAAELERDELAVSTARCVVANSEMAAADLQRHYGLPLDRTKVVRNGVDLDRFSPGPGSRPAGVPAGAPLLAFVGTGYSRKGLGTALEALTSLPGVHLAVAGADPRPARFRRRAAGLGIADRVHWLGAVDRPEDLLRAADAFVLPTRYDPSANASLEAMACGLPVLTTIADGAAEVLPERWMAVSPGDATALAGAVERALHTPGLGAACRSVAERRPAAVAFEELAAVAADLVT